MPNKHTAHRAAMLADRLRSLTDPAHAAAYGDLTSLRVIEGSENTVIVEADFSDDTSREWIFTPGWNAYRMRDKVQQEVDKRCADIRKARREADLDRVRYAAEHGIPL